MSELLTIGDAARVLGVSIDTMRRWERDGKIAPRRTAGGQRRYRMDQLKPLLISAPSTELSDQSPSV